MKILYILCSLLLLFAFTLPLTAVEEEEDDVDAEEQVISGQLLSLDPDLQTFVLLAADGSQMEFSYNDQTVVLRAEGSVQGLAALNSDAYLTVYYLVKEDWEEEVEEEDVSASILTALRIEVVSEAEEHDESDPPGR